MVLQILQSHVGIILHIKRQHMKEKKNCDMFLLNSNRIQEASLPLIADLNFTTMLEPVPIVELLETERFKKIMENHGS